MNHYIRQSLSAFIALVAFTMLFNIWADPYNIYRFGSADMQRMSRIDQGMTMRLSKPWQVHQRNAAAAVIGSSRSGSMSPQHALWLDKQPFNLSMPGLTLYEMLRTIEHAHANGPLSDLVIGLEYETFIAGDYKAGIGFSEKRLAASTSAEFYQQVMQDFLTTTLTTSAITRSTMAINHRKPITTRYFPDGHWENESRAWRGESGYVSVGKNMARLTKGASSIYSENLKTFADIVEFCQRENIKTTLFISPEHIFLTGLRKVINPRSNWKKFHRDLKNINRKAANQYDQQPFPLWGFNHLKGIVDEPLPSGDIDPSAWFRDGIHFHNKLGIRLMDQMLEASHHQSFELSQGSIDDYLQSVDKLQLYFFSNNQKVTARYLAKIL
ncbi:hypothetical protein EYC87_13910 [Halieaceae bacterium IMCC8485]|uniref:AlgX/AlgJ SGNH hydrolase-like domain-containing protein n=1 Tax=Candidatus Seongchinamella marina TaxID=2518990 RepID=A0ABT3SZI1_9GAMM|nr:hypothetical protein [Candidatus Seongchinamella marina]MCX2974684.1 hypothetical protein [Candidatus Seongchinamella marina]